MSRNSRRATAAGKAERHATDLSAKLGAALRDARRRSALTQSHAARRAGIAQGTWSALEIERDPRYTLLTWDRAAFAVGTTLDAFIRGASAADQPRDAVHLRNQELIIRTALAGGWRALPEEPIDREARTSRAADVLLHRRRAAAPAELVGPALPAEYAICEIWDWLDDVGGSLRDFSRRLDAIDRYAVARMIGDDPLPGTSGCWVLRATRRNRHLVAEHRNLFRARFPGSGHAWVTALTNPAALLPSQPALLWVAVNGEKVFPARLG